MHSAIFEAAATVPYVLLIACPARHSRSTYSIRTLVPTGQEASLSIVQSALLHEAVLLVIIVLIDMIDTISTMKISNIIVSQSALALDVP